MPVADEHQEHVPSKQQNTRNKEKKNMFISHAGSNILRRWQNKTLQGQKRRMNREEQFSVPSSSPKIKKEKMQRSINRGQHAYREDWRQCVAKRREELWPENRKQDHKKTSKSATLALVPPTRHLDYLPQVFHSPIPYRRAHGLPITAIKVLGDELWQICTKTREG